MRKKLAILNAQRKRFVGIFVRYGTRSAFRGPPITTLLVRDVKLESGEMVCDHLWFTITKGFAALGNLVEGDVLAFDARVTPYLKGYRGQRLDVEQTIEQDYRLSRPTKIQKIQMAAKESSMPGEPVGVGALRQEPCSL